MKTLRFNTNIKCGGCVAAVSPVLNTVEQIKNWKVDLHHLNKPLTITTDLSPMEVVKLVEKAGYKASAS